VISRRRYLNRGQPPKRKSWLKRGTKPIPTRNEARIAKRKKAYSSFLKSAVWKRIRKEAIERAGGQCEHLENLGITTPRVIGYARCQNTGDLTVDHLSYAHFGGKEQPHELKVLCRFHHNRKSALTGKRGRTAA
jgi:5-methylcytosine-specific restriction endonuclease McrA